jgi:hypothetical protein
MTAPCLVGSHAWAQPISGADSLAEIDTWVAMARERNLAAAPVWRSLLHISDGRANITSPDFLLSLPDFAPDTELVATLRFLYSGNDTHVCRFPARYLWLRHQLDTPELPMGS